MIVLYMLGGLLVPAGQLPGLLGALASLLPTAALAEPDPFAYDRSERGRVRELAAAWSKQARSTTTAGQERAILRMLGVAGTAGWEIAEECDFFDQDAGRSPPLPRSRGACAPRRVSTPAGNTLRAAPASPPR